MNADMKMRRRRIRWIDLKKKAKSWQEHSFMVKKGERESKRRRERYLKQGGDPRYYYQIKEVF